MAGFVACNQVQKEVISKPKQPSCKKRMQPPQKASVKKDVKSKVVAKNGCGGRFTAKKLMTINNDNSGGFALPPPNG